VNLLGIPANLAVSEQNWMLGRWLGVLFGGVGLAITLREVAYLHAAFTRADRL
jgi:hypothetical protein